MDRMAMPAAAPQQSRSTSVTWPERPATKSCIVSSTVGTKAQNTAVANNAPRDTVRRGPKACEAKMPKMRYSVKCAVFRTRKFVTHSHGRPRGRPYGGRLTGNKKIGRLLSSDFFRVVFSRPLPAVFPFPPLQGEQLPQHVGMVFPHGMPRGHQVGTCEALPALAYRLF